VIKDPVGPLIARPSFCYIAQLESRVKAKVQKGTRSGRHGGSVLAIERIHFFDLDPGKVFYSASGCRALFAIIITGFPQIASDNWAAIFYLWSPIRTFRPIYSSFETAVSENFSTPRHFLLDHDHLCAI
jgi:hypothetical protein